MITSKEVRKNTLKLYLNGSYEIRDSILDYITQQEKVNELLKEHIQLSYDLEYMLVHGIKDNMKYTKTANRLLTVREKLQEILNWKLEGELNDW